MEYKNNVIDYLAFVEEMKAKSLITTEVDKMGEYYNNIIIDVKFLKGLYKIYEPNQKFLELGCGVGNVLRFAQNIGYDAIGVELNSELTKDLGNEKIVNTNILKINPKEYKKYDVIYCYRPLKTGYEEYIDLVADNMKINAVLFVPTYNFKKKGFTKISNFMYQKTEA